MMPAESEDRRNESGRRPFTLGLGTMRRLLAPRCVVCDLDRGDPLCPGCAGDYFASDAPRCSSCALRLPATPGGDRCGRCLQDPPRFDATVALADYAPPVDRMIAALKFGGRLPLAEAFGTLLARQAAPWLQQVDAICGVPLAFERHAERGFNQAHEIAHRVAAASGRPLRSGLVLRTRNTASQMDLALADRQRNVRGAFAGCGNLGGLHVAVVDDVMTTGATLGEVAAALKRAGAARVLNLVVARTP